MKHTFFIFESPGEGWYRGLIGFYSEEEREKRSLRGKRKNGLVHSDETKRKQSDAIRAWWKLRKELALNNPTNID